VARAYYFTLLAKRKLRITDIKAVGVYGECKLLHIMAEEKDISFQIINGIIGTVISELLWLWGCLLTSSLMATLAIGLTIPLSILVKASSLMIKTEFILQYIIITG